ncbi:multicopper oxidase family protein [Brevibacterium album]|uniref:multicopper oxidase family protein n=1 Tax=Brevibacterium album TaxID=417948 RepID=UPI00068545DD|nr:multicopper oxidase domain-containing protein [Brevibacterium album]
MSTRGHALVPARLGSVPAVLSRRGLLRGGSAFLGLAALAPALTACAGETPVPTTEEGRPLPIPPLLEPDEHGRFALTASTGTTEFLPGVPSETWGYNGAHLGPTLRLARGRTYEAQLTNDTDEETTFHWHGLLVPAHADGGPHHPIAPGETQTLTLTPDQPSATLWYHPHPHESTSDQVRRGLAGMLLLDDPDGHTPGSVPQGMAASPAEAPSASPEAASALPHEYGVDDIPLIIQDLRLTDDGELLGHNFTSEVGMLGETVLTNGMPDAVLTTDREVLRLRLLNGSLGRIYGLRLDSGAPLTVIGSDGGLLPEPVEADSLTLSPAERAEVIVAVPADGLTLVSRDPDLGNVSDPEGVGGEDEFTILRVRRDSPAEAEAGEEDGSGAGASADFRSALAALDLPDRLAELPDPVDAGQQRSFSLRGRQINGTTMDMDRIDAAMSSHEPEVWLLTNLDSSPHNFHIHNAQFRILDVGGRPPAPELAGWKDTVYTPPQEAMRIAVVMPHHEDDDGSIPYMYHCHLLLHEDDGMMGQFTVDAEPDAATGHGDH